ncbi:MAG TPA: DUF169 domain-containing protein [Syntrophomonas sp.]|nr:DUF169 domain-containing protein [Syntrophomonas sp.]
MMDMHIKEEFIRLWSKYFNDAELPLAFYYTNEPAQPDTAAKCIIATLAKTRKGSTVVFSAESVRCFGGTSYLGFSEIISEAFSDEYKHSYREYFLSHGVPGQIEGERFKKTPAICQEMYLRMPAFKAPARYCVFKRWDMLDEKDIPEVVIFFAKPDVLSGLYNLANYDTVDANEVIIPWGSGCSSIVKDPYFEKDTLNPRAVIGMLDVSARPFVSRDELTFSVPMKKFIRMVESMEESFLSTKAWGLVQNRI